MYTANTWCELTGQRRNKHASKRKRVGEKHVIHCHLNVQAGKRRSNWLQSQGLNREPSAARTRLGPAQPGASAQVGHVRDVNGRQGPYRLLGFFCEEHVQLLHDCVRLFGEHQTLMHRPLLGRMIYIESIKYCLYLHFRYVCCWIQTL